MHDLVLKGGQVIDGTGQPRRRADVAITDGQVVQIDDNVGLAQRTIDVQGLLVAPGFVDVHTHLDVQAFWDPTLSPSPLHGVTTVFAGNCGFTVAPLDEEAGPYLMRMLARVEGMPLASLEVGVPWDWRSSEEYFQRYAALRPAVNVGFMIGHSALRRVVMGQAAVERKSTPEELAAMQELLRAGLRAGGIGFSSTVSRSHNDADGVPVPSRHASFDEIVALAGVCGEFAGTSLELLPHAGPTFPVEVIDLMARMSVAAQRPLNWNALPVRADNIAETESKLSASDYARERGGKVIALSVPSSSRGLLNFDSGFVLDMVNGWDSFFRLSREERLRRLSDPAERARLEEIAAPSDALPNLVNWSSYEIAETFSPDAKRYEGRLVGDIASEEGKTPFDALLDIVVTDDLKTRIVRKYTLLTAADWEQRAKRYTDPRVLVGASDAGAHLDMIGTFNYTTRLIAALVREHGFLSAEDAVHLLTQAPAELYGLKDRGVLAEGAMADVVVFDESTIGSHELATRADLPTGAERLYAGATGIEHVLVSGEPIVEGSEFTGARPGVVLRSGRDTNTPSLN
jgi:N-acyl-D-aspartate/D-glutamate deacylase